MATQFNDAFEILEQLGDDTVESRADHRDRTKGLPDEKARLELAETFLNDQHLLWPDLVKAGALPPLGDRALRAMSDSFRTTFEAGQWTPFRDRRGNKLSIPLGAAYLRYSDEGSNTRSLDQQLHNVLEKARRENIFVPWNYVFADAAITGTTSARRGYTITKRLVASKLDAIDTLFIDELGRASRDIVETLSLGRTMKLARKRILGATDGFDSNSDFSKGQLVMSGWMNEGFIDQLRAKVRRGRKDAFRRGKNVNKPPFGCKLVPLLGPDGMPLHDRDGFLLKVRVIDPEWAPDVVRAKTLFADHSWSWVRIAKDFNDRRVGNRDKWTSSGIGKLLKRTVYSGVEYDNLTFQVKDETTGKVTVHLRPEEEWLKRSVPDMRMISDELESRVQSRLAKLKKVLTKTDSEEKASRSELHPKSLVRPYCSGCKKPMNLARAGRYKTYFCDNGKQGIGGCRFHGYKSATIIDTLILDRVLREVISDSFLSTVVEEANRGLGEAPAREAKAVRAAVEKRVAKHQRQMSALEKAMQESGEEAVSLKIVVKKVADLQRLIDVDKIELAELSKPVTDRARPLTIEDVTPLIADLRALLNSDVGAAAPALKELIGKVVVTLEPMEKGGKPEWKAHFKLNGVPIFLFLARRRKCPSAPTWELLNTRRWTIGRKVDFWLRMPRKHERISAEVKVLADQGLSTNAIAVKLRTNWTVVKAAWEFANAGGTCTLVATPKKPPNDLPKSRQRDEEIVRLRDVEGMSFLKIAKKLGIGNATVSTGYQRGQCAAQGLPYRRSPIYNLPKEIFATIESMCQGDYKDKEIAKAAGCSITTVRRHRKANSKLPT